MNSVKLVLSFIRRKPLTWAFNVLSLALGVAVVVGLLLISDGLSQRFSRDLADVDLVIGAKGSPLQLILSAIFQLDSPTGNIRLADAQPFATNALVRRAVPMSLGDNVRGFRIVGTNSSYADIYHASLAKGAWWAEPMQAVLGADAARTLNLKLGSTFVGEHGLAAGGEVHADNPYRVVGILKPTGAVIDRLVLTDTASVWKVHEHEYAEHGAEPGEVSPALDANGRPEREITALLVSYRSPLGAVMLPRQVSAVPNMQPAIPAIEVARLTRLLGTGAEVMQAFGIGLLALAGFGFVVTLSSAVSQRAPELALLRTLGAHPSLLFRLVTVEAVLLGLVAGAVGLAIGWGAAYVAADASAAARGPVLLLPQVGDRDVLILAGAVAISFIAALGPAIGAYRVDPARILRAR
jgi:putative ABC transport system permease protein